MTPDDAVRMRHRLLRLQDTVVGIDPAVMRPVVDSLSAAIDEPLRVAVVGSVKAGKSTLVNALVGRRVAPTDEAECTRIVTWYRYGGPERAVLHLLDGSERRLPSSPERMLPDELPVPVGSVSHAEVFVQEAALRDCILIDTPGLGSTDEDYSGGTRRAVLQSVQADALLYVVRDSVLGDDADFVRRFLSSAGGRGGAADVIGVLSHADVFGGSPWMVEDPVVQAGRHAVRQQERHRAELGAMVPFAGLLAEAVATGRITGADVALLAALDEVDDEDLQDGEGLPEGTTWSAVEELASRVGWYGIARGRAPAAVGVAAVLEWAERTGGRAALAGELRDRYVGRHRQLRAAQVLRTCELAADASTERTRLRDAIAEVRLAPELHPLRELRAWEALRSADPSSPLVADLELLLDSEDDRQALGLQVSAAEQDIARTAVERAASARQAALFAATTAEEVAARALEESFTRIARRW